MKLVTTTFQSLDEGFFISNQVHTNRSIIP